MSLFAALWCTVIALWSKNGQVIAAMSYTVYFLKPNPATQYDNNNYRRLISSLIAGLRGVAGFHRGFQCSDCGVCVCLQAELHGRDLLLPEAQLLHQSPQILQAGKVM